VPGPSGYGPPPGYGYGYGQPQGYGYPAPPGYGYGPPPGHGYGPPPGYGYGPPPGYGYGYAPQPSKADLLPAAGLGRRALARTIDVLLALVLLIIPFGMIGNDRPFAHVFLGILGVAAYEALFTTWTGATPGKLVCNIRVAELRLTGPLSPAAAVRRGLLIGVVLPIGALVAFSEEDEAGVVVGLIWFAIAATTVGLSTILSPLHRGFHDRLFATFVVQKAAPAFIDEPDLERWTDIHVAPDPTPYGPSATLDQRRRARASRLDDAPMLVLVLVACAVIGTVFDGGGWWTVAIMWTIWLVAFVADETWRVARFGATAGHRRAGLAVVDIDTGEPPSPKRSFLRAALLGLLLYTVVLLPVLAFWVRVARFNRGPHDRIGRTAVVAISRRATEEATHAAAA